MTPKWQSIAFVGLQKTKTAEFYIYETFDTA